MGSSALGDSESQWIRQWSENDSGARHCPREYGGHWPVSITSKEYSIRYAQGSYVYDPISDLDGMRSAGLLYLPCEGSGRYGEV